MIAAALVILAVLWLALELGPLPRLFVRRPQGRPPEPATRPSLFLAHEKDIAAWLRGRP